MLMREYAKLRFAEEVSRMPYFTNLTRVISSAVERLIERAPSDSMIVMDVTKVGDGFRAVIRVASSGLDFLIEGTARNPFEAAERAFTKTRARFEDWSEHKKV